MQSMKNIKPTTPSQRFLKQVNNKAYSSKINLIKKLTCSLKKTGGRCRSSGKITVRHRGGGHKKIYRIVDFKRNKNDILGLVTCIEYDPFRNVKLGLVVYLDGEKKYILAPKDIKLGDFIISSNLNIKNFNFGNSLKLKYVPAGIPIHLIENHPNSNTYSVRSAGTKAQIVNFNQVREQALIKLPSGKIKYFSIECRCTIGIVGNVHFINTKLGKAGRSRWLGFRPKVRGVAMNPVDHPMGGGEGKTSGGGHPKNKWGKLTRGGKTRRKYKFSTKNLTN